MNDLVPSLEELGQQISDIYKAGFIQSRLVLVDTYHQIGQLIMNLPAKYDAVQDLARTSGISKRTLYYSAKFYEKFPERSLVPEGDNISWNKLVTKYLPDKVEKHQHEWEVYRICRCGIREKVTLEDRQAI